ncbi:MAG: GAF domain-containing sensor histidine kinase [Leptolyngbyaceae cyanobacterium bins.59]|nr:GAF domain-containing sensor histidine kinase [Leptolyngbyaceae cyanobacterium bins.59]
MVIPENKPLYPFNTSTQLELEQQRLTALSELGLLETESIPIFDEATQTAAHFLEMPICILGLLDQDREWLKSAIGLSRLGLMNDLASSRQIPSHHSFTSLVVSTRQVLVIEDTLADPRFAENPLVQQYRIRSYVGVPLIDGQGHFLGALAVMDLTPRVFTAREVGFLELTARWSMSEFERNRLVRLSQAVSHQTIAHFTPSASKLETAQRDERISEKPDLSLANPIRVQLLSQLTQELRTPLTSVMGMTSVLTREIYGPLTTKQKEYLAIVYQSGQYLLSLVNEIMELGSLEDGSESLNLSSVDIEMLCQQVITTLEEAAKRREQQMRLTVEPGPRIWLLDKHKVKQMLYHLIFSVIQSSVAGSEVRLHISRKQSRLNIAVWVSNPWLGDSLPYGEVYAYQATRVAFVEAAEPLRERYRQGDSDAENLTLNPPGAIVMNREAEAENFAQPAIIPSRESLGLQLSRQLAAMHEGQISIQGSPESGYRYVISLPQLSEADLAS